MSTQHTQDIAALARVIASLVRELTEAKYEFDGVREAQASEIADLKASLSKSEAARDIFKAALDDSERGELSAIETLRRERDEAKRNAELLFTQNDEICRERDALKTELAEQKRLAEYVQTIEAKGSMVPLKGALPKIAYVTFSENWDAIYLDGRLAKDDLCLGIEELAELAPALGIHCIQLGQEASNAIQDIPKTLAGLRVYSGEE